MTPADLHECPQCKGVFECLSSCGLGFFGRLCSMCLRLGYQMGECKRCERLVPIHDDRWACDDCYVPKVAVA